MFLAYMDDSGSSGKRQSFQVMTAVIIPHEFFHAIESRSIGGLSAYIPEDRAEDFWEKFDEFKGWQLFGGYGPFDGIDQRTRYGLIEYMLELVTEFRMSIVYGAVQKHKFGVNASANPLDVSFRVCMEGIAARVKQEATSEDYALLVVDFSNKDSKILHRSFHDFRRGMRREGMEPFPAAYLHDDMYFGDSRYSIGIQLADLCGYFIVKHLQGDPAGEGFYNLIKDRIVYSRVEPVP